MNLSNITQTISEKFNAIEEYFDNRIKTGRFIQDISYYSKVYSHSLKEKNKQNITNLSQSQTFKKNSSTFRTLIEQVNKLPFIGPIITTLVHFLKIFLFYYADIFIIFAITFPSSIFLANLYQSHPSSFFILLIPILFLITYCYAALFLYIQKRLGGEKITLFHTFPLVVKKIPSLFFSIMLQLTIVIQLIIGYFVIAYLYSDLFTFLDILWSGSFVYWFVVVFLALLLCFIIFLTIIITHQVFFIMLFEDLSFNGALQSAWRYQNKNQFLLYIFYFLIFSLLLSTIYKTFLYSLFTGAAVSIFLYNFILVFIGFTIYNKYYRKDTYEKNINTSTSITIPLIIIFFGIINYILLSLLSLKQYDAFNRFIYAQRADYFFNAELQNYVNRSYAYTIEYPKTWSLYEKSSNNVRFYNNYNGTISGGIWLDIVVNPYNESDFIPYYNAPIGKLSTNERDNSTSYKVSNISIDGNEGVSYTVDKKSLEDPSYQTIYLIHKDDLLYTLSFTSKSKSTEGYSYGIVDKIINSFRFIK